MSGVTTPIITKFLQDRLILCRMPPQRVKVVPCDTDCTCLKLGGHRMASHQISTRCTEMTANYSAEMKIAIFQSIWKRQRDE